MKHRTILLAAYLIVKILLAAVRVSADTWYVDNGARGANTGRSWTDAWKSFSSIVWGGSGVGPGDTLYISGGSTSKTYAESLAVGVAGTSGAQITIQTGQTPGHNGTAAITRGARLKSYVTLSGQVNGGRRLKVSHPTSNGIMSSSGSTGTKILYVEVSKCGDAKGDNGISISGVKNLEIAYCYIHDNIYGDGINLPASGGTYGSNLFHHNTLANNADDGIICDSGVDIYDNVIYGGQDYTMGHPDGIQALGNYVRVWRNVIYSMKNSCIFVTPFDKPSAHHIRIYNNLLYRGSMMTGRGIQIKTPKASLSDAVIANNTIIDMYNWGIYLDSNASYAIDGVKIVNNIIFNCYTASAAGSAIQLLDYTAVQNLTIDYNQVHAGSRGCSRISYHGTYTQPHGVSAAPVFTSYSMYSLGNDYHLTSRDPAVRKATDLSAYFTDDLDRRTRATWDIGCYYYGGATDTTRTLTAPDGLRVAE